MGARQYQEVIGFPTSLEIWKNPSHPLQFLKPIFNFPVLHLVPVHGILVVWFRALVARVGRLNCTASRGAARAASRAAAFTTIAPASSPAAVPSAASSFRRSPVGHNRP